MISIKHNEVMDGKAIVVEVEGSLDSYTSADFEDYINQLLKNNSKYIFVDAEKMEYVSSEGIGLFLFIQRKISDNNGFFIVFNLSNEIESLYAMLGFDKIIHIVPDKADAIKMMEKQIVMNDITQELKDDVNENFKHDITNNEKVEELNKENDDNKIYPLIVECTNCKALIRVNKQGSYLCPDCGKEFSSDNSKSKKKSIEIKERKDPGMNIEPIITECVKCKSLIRVKKTGHYKCPECKTEFEMKKDQSVVFL